MMFCNCPAPPYNVYSTLKVFWCYSTRDVMCCNCTKSQFLFVKFKQICLWPYDSTPHLTFEPLKEIGSKLCIAKIRSTTNIFLLMVLNEYLMNKIQWMSDHLIKCLGVEYTKYINIQKLDICSFRNEVSQFILLDCSPFFFFVLWTKKVKFENMK